jgi:hypothetical protein
MWRTSVSYSLSGQPNGTAMDHERRLPARPEKQQLQGQAGPMVGAYAPSICEPEPSERCWWTRWARPGSSALSEPVDRFLSGSESVKQGEKYPAEGRTTIHEQGRFELTTGKAQSTTSEMAGVMCLCRRRTLSARCPAGNGDRDTDRLGLMPNSLVSWTARHYAFCSYECQTGTSLRKQPCR